MRLLITGGSSYLGRHLVPLAAESSDVCFTYWSRSQDLPGQARRLDIRRADQVLDLARTWRPDVIIHAAGSNRGEDMAAVIRQGAAHICQAAAQVEARLIFLSTDVIFDGTAGPYEEDEPPRPQHAYGRAKAAAEALVAAYPEHVIVRPSLIYGLAAMDHGTASFIRTLAAGRPLTLYTDQLRNPVWVQSLSQACLELAGSPYRGILHVAGAQGLSRAEFGLRMLDWWQIEARKGLTLAPDAEGRFPRDCRLNTDRARRLLRTPLPGVDAVLAAARARRQR